MASKSTPKGMRDFLPEDMIIRKTVFELIETVYRKYGYRPLETPALEYLDTLKAKAGEGIEGEIFQVDGSEGKENEYGLRFDLTVPLARVAANTAEPKPFKRYCISRVWRKEEPQRGRFREFWQADIDIIGCKEMRAEAEILAVAREVMMRFGFPKPRILLNNRKIMNAIIEKLDLGENIDDILRILDKTDKIGDAAARAELKKLVGEQSTRDVLKLVKMTGTNEEKLANIEGICKEGVEELRQIIELCDFDLEVDLAMVRGLGYYTGPVFEIKLSDDIGGIAGGGRYDNLLELYGQKNCATGISIGIERLITLMKERSTKEQPMAKTYTQIFVGAVKPEFYNYALNVANELRIAGISTETDLNDRNLRKQMDYANSLGIAYFAVVGEREANEKKATLKDMKTGKEEVLSIPELVTKFAKR